MPSYKAPVADAMFLLRDVFHWDRYGNLPGFVDAPLDVTEAILGEAGKLAEAELQPVNASGDREGCTRREDGTVTTPKGFKKAYDAYAQGGWIGLAAPGEYGGQGLPYTLAAIVNEFCAAANMALTMYPGLTQGAVAALLRHGNDAQKKTYVPAMLEGRWSGTMNLTEPHCGTDLGLLKTKAAPQGDGSFKISGQKIFISAGEHDLTENIVHLVLARIEGAPAGVKGISLFVVPKFLPGPDGAPGARNAVSCGSIEHKMGIHGNATCVMNYDGATGWLVGEANRGLAAMFVMMNEARLGVAMQGLAQSEVAWQNASAYAKERVQGRSLTGAKAPDKAADPLIVHPDVRRMLLEAASFNAAARALAIYAGLQSDLSVRAADDKERQAADDRLGLLTPVLKGVFTDTGFANAVQAQQVLGGHGYVAEWGLEQFVRDARIAMIYEGANGVQALDLVGRKLPKDGGRAMTALMGELAAFAKEQAAEPRMAEFVGPLKVGLDQLQKATFWLMANGLARPDDAGAASYDYMHLFGLVLLGWMHCRIARACIDAAPPDADRRLKLARFFMARRLPEAAAHLAKLSSGAATLMAFEPAEM
ncbi:MAG: acyl-CoA dehydrogenase C-terminal domain-containing protein [Hyphomicrobiales bacterium]|nr:acyl-CoA dehydrogenase C-terminal domain-containing protein [Hyphomicrobiales bacterium]